jgi:pyruvate formate lyase activating enzyme
MLISGIQKVTLIDYPGKIACVLFTHGCNFRCAFCHNPELVLEKPDLERVLEHKEVFDFLDTRKGKLDGVVITGGEPLLHPKLFSFIQKIKKKGFFVKLDTNGSFPKPLGKMLEAGLLDYVAMDVKTDLKNYRKITSWDGDVQKIRDSIAQIINKAPEYEFRSTLVKGLHSRKDVLEIAKLVRGARKFTVQNFISSETISKDLGKKNEFKRAELEKFSKILEEYVKEVDIRNSY